jgi:hypothetical protein
MPAVRRIEMKSRYGKLAATFGALILGLVCAPSSWAACGINQPAAPTHSSWYVQPGGPSLLQVALVNANQNDDAGIVGMWHVTFTAKTMNGARIPATVVDDALVVWHSDHTEIMNSGRPPQDGDFCMGVWEQVGRTEYTLNHYTWGGNDAAPNAPAGTVGPPSAAPTHITEEVILSRDGNHFSGAFTLDAPDTHNVVTSFTGVITATRITIHTKPSDL